jgi:sugar O-acyltransferase (sialic acid O-acetyltransferase NeuD family)
MKKIILIGGGGHCKSVIDVIEQEKKYKIYGIVDKPKFFGTKILGYKVIGSDLDLDFLAKKYKNAIITVGQIQSPLVRINLFNLARKAGFKFPSIISPRAYVSKYSRIGMGTIVLHNVVVNSNVSIGNNCIINTKSLIEHDCEISDHCHISTCATINGSVQIKSKCFIGSNATIRDGITIKENSFIKASSLLKK